MFKLRSFFYFLIILSITTVSNTAHGAIASIERAALIALYNSTNGDNWKSNNGWKTPPLDSDGFAMPGTENSWYGITVTNDTVTRLDLDSNQLSDAIPPELENLSKLWYVKSWNEFGKIWSDGMSFEVE